MVQLITHFQSRDKKKNNQDGGRKWVVLGVISLQVFLTISVINSLTFGLVNMAQFLFGLNLLAFGGLLYVYIKAKNEKGDPKLPIKGDAANYDHAYLA